MPSHEAREEGGEGQARPSCLMLPCGLAQRVLLTKLVKLDGDVHPYLATLMVATLAWAGETLVIPEGTQITTITREAFDNMLLKEASHNYDNYGLVS